MSQNVKKIKIVRFEIFLCVLQNSFSIHHCGIYSSVEQIASLGNRAKLYNITFYEIICYELIGKETTMKEEDQFLPTLLCTYYKTEI